jgi:hypothetical protein
MRRDFLNILSGAALDRQAFNALVKHFARSFQAVDLLLLPGDYLVQFLQQIFLISDLYFQLNDSFVIHTGT